MWRKDSFEMGKSILRISGLLLLLWVSYLIIDRIQHYSYIYLSIFWVLLSFSFFFLSKKKETKLRLFILYSGCVFVALGLAEVFYSGLLSSKKPIYSNISETEVIYGRKRASHLILGSKTSENSKYIERRYAGNELILSYTHSTDEFGWRKVNNQNSGDTNKEAILFFGGSFTYGLGVSDDQNIASMLQHFLKPSYNVYNFANDGYGPHQMLALLENGLEEEAIHGDHPKIVFYQAIQDHLSRIKGQAIWDLQGPKYELTANKEVVYKGAFNAPEIAKLKTLLAKSFLLRKIFFRKNKVSDAGVNLLAHIVKKSAVIFEQKYDGKFYVILWEEKVEEKESYVKLYNRLINLGLDVIEIKDILPDYYPQSPTYFIERDNHPNAYAYRLISEYIKENILE